MHVLYATRSLHTFSPTLYSYTFAIQLRRYAYPHLQEPLTAQQVVVLAGRALIDTPHLHHTLALARGLDAMAGQQQQIMDTIFSMKRKMLRKDDCGLIPTSTQA